MMYYRKPLLAVLLLAIVLSSATIDLNNLMNYANQSVPSYITKDNTTNNQITDFGATLGRVLFYDKNLSINNTIACASCHIQEFAFGDTAILSTGYDGGQTGRHSMRLINSRFAQENRFFWDERANTLEEQTTQPIQDHVEMGFSNSNGNPDFDSLITKLKAIPYYKPLFEAAFGNDDITEDRMQLALAQFVRSIQSFDSKYDQGRAQVANDQTNFPNFTASENRGKALFLAPPPAGGAGCAGCHRAPEFDIDPQSLNNGIVGSASSATTIDISNTKAPTLRDIVNPNGDLNGPLMHNGRIVSLQAVINHYNAVPINNQNTNLDPRLAGPGGNLQLTTTEQEDLINFLKTLTGSAVYTDERWSDPFDANGNISVVALLTSVYKPEKNENSIAAFPNPFVDRISLKNLANPNTNLNLYATNGQLIWSGVAANLSAQPFGHLAKGVYFLALESVNDKATIIKLVKE